MRKILIMTLVLVQVIAFCACTKEDVPAYQVSNVKITLAYPAGEGFEPAADVAVTLKNASTGTVFTDSTDAQGVALFEVPQGIYEAAASDKRVKDARVYLFNGINSAVNASTATAEAVINLELSVGGSIVIKELYVGGCPKDDGSGTFARDQYVVLYNNSSETLDISDFALGMVNPYNPHSANKDYVNGELLYASEGWIPAGTAVWYFDKQVQLEAGKELVIALAGAIDHTATYTKSVNLANSNYCCLYDIEDFNNAMYYPSPSEVIPTSNYLKAYKYGVGNAWPVSQFGPAFFIFRPEGTTLQAFVDDASTTNLYNGSASQPRKKVPAEWVVDGIEVFVKGVDTNQKRLLPVVDAGYVEFTRAMGYSLYRNVDKEATEAIAANEGKLVYNYSLGVDASTDPSGIDAEASLKKGARIVYKDTNNSTADFHQKSQASLRN